MKFFYTDHFELPLPDTHQFPMSKYRLLRERILGCAEIPGGCLCVPEAATKEQLRRVHTSDFVGRVFGGELKHEEIRRIGFPWSPFMVERSRRSVGATLAAAYACLEDGVAMNLAGGTHHSFPNFGAGYCIFNDVAVSVRELQAMKLATTVAVIDCDAHQGDGTAVIFANDPSVFTFSMHSAKAFPARKQTSDLDIALPEETGDAEYLSQLRSALPRVAEAIHPNVVFYVAGADPFANDRLGRLKLTKQGLKERDEIVLNWCREQQVPVAICMAGGYSADVNDIVDIHFQTVLAAWRFSKTATNP